MTEFINHPLHPGEAVPLFISAGILKEPAQLEQFIAVQDPLLVPALTLGSFTWDEWSGNAKAGETDFVYYPHQKLAGNARGLPNPGREGVVALRDSIARLSDKGVKTIISITNLPFESPQDVVPQLAETAASVQPTAIEVNLSCPNGKDEAGTLLPPVSDDMEASFNVLTSVREVIGDVVLLGAKDSPHAASVEGPIDAAAVGELAIVIAGQLDFVTGINTVGGQPFPEITCAGGKGGASGPAVADLARHHLRIWQDLAPDIPYLSTGGVDSNNAASEINKRLAGGAMRVGGAQEFYRAGKLTSLVERWVQVL